MYNSVEQQGSFHTHTHTQTRAVKLEGTFTDRMKTDGWLLLHQEWPPKEEGSGVNGFSNTGKQERKK